MSDHIQLPEVGQLNHRKIATLVGVASLVRDIKLYKGNERYGVEGGWSRLRATL